MKNPFKNNPIKQMKEKTEQLAAQMGELGTASRDQTKLLQKNVEIMQKQSLIMQSWAVAAEAQAKILQNISETLHDISETLKAKNKEVKE